MLAYTTALKKCEAIPDRFLVLAARLSLAAFFIRAGQTKLDGFDLSSGAQYLFQEEYKVPLLPWDVAAWMAIAAEHIFPILLIVGLATRLSALGLLGMALIIQFFVYPGSWPDHLMWATLLMLIIARGPGAFSLDNLFNKKFLA
jgi:putative oxidoreductase